MKTKKYNHFAWGLIDLLVGFCLGLFFSEYYPVGIFLIAIIIVFALVLKDKENEA